MMPQFGKIVTLFREGETPITFLSPCQTAERR